MASDNVWTAATAGAACLTVRVNGREEKNISKSGIADLKSFIGEKAARAGISKYRVKINSEKVEPEDVEEMTVSDVNVIEIDTYDQVRA